VQFPQVLLLEGGTWGAAQAEGRAVVAVFWSITCAYCRSHNAHIETLRRAACGLPLEPITIAHENDANAVRAAMARHGWHFAATLDYPPMAAALSQRRLTPLTVSVDRRGRLKQLIPGEMSEDDVLELRRLAT
jgi:hypothetical protein